MLFLANALNIYDRQALGAVLEPLRREFHLSDAQLGAIPTAFIVIYALAGVPLGRAVDRGSRKRLLAAGVAVWAGLTALGGLAGSYAMLFATRLGVGIGEAVCAPAATSWIGDLVPAGRRARAMAAFMMAVPVGIMLSFAISGPVAQAYGWRAALGGRCPRRAAGAGAAAAGRTAVARGADHRLLWSANRRAPVGRRRKAIFCPTDTRWQIAGGRCRVGPFPAAHPRALVDRAFQGALANFVLYSFSYFLAAFLTRFHATP